MQLIKLLGIATLVNAVALSLPPLQIYPSGLEERSLRCHTWPGTWLRSVADCWALSLQANMS